MKKTIFAFVIGLIFGLGLTISQMINPAKVLGFLDIFGAWDPSLVLVMGGALAVTFVGYRLAWLRSAPVLADRFVSPNAAQIDPRLLGGAVLFGIGWGLTGYCPGPAISSITVGGSHSILFLAAMLAGMGLFSLTDKLMLKTSHHIPTTMISNK